MKATYQEKRGTYHHPAHFPEHSRLEPQHLFDVTEESSEKLFIRTVLLANCLYRLFNWQIVYTDCFTGKKSYLERAFGLHGTG